MKNKMKKAIILFVAIALVSTSYAATAKTSEKADEEMVPAYLKNPNSVTTEPSNPTAPLGPIIFEQLPFLPDESWIFYTSDASAGYLTMDNYEVEVDVCDIHWWGLSLVYPWAPCDPTGMVFEIIFWDQSGSPVCVYQVSPPAQQTGLFYSGFEMYYWETDLDPCCPLTNGWVSIQSISCPAGCWFLWAGSDDGDLFCYQNDIGQYTDCAFELTAGGPTPEPAICCDPGITSWSDVVPGSTVTGTFYVWNCGDDGSTLNWEVDSWPAWMGSPVFTPDSGSIVAPGAGTDVTFTFTAPTDENQNFAGTIKVINEDDPSDYCEFDTTLATPRMKQIQNTFFLRLLQQFPNAFPLLRYIMGI